MIKIYYHLAKINNWSNVTNNFFETIFSSGLYDDCEEIKIGVVCEEEKLIEKEFEFLKYDKIKITKVGNLCDFEIPTLRMIYEDLNFSNNFNLFYFHSKGVSFDLNNWNVNHKIIKKQYLKRKYEKFEDAVRAYKYTRYWCKLLLIKDYKSCIDLLKDDDVVCLKKSHNNKFIPVNFWWAKSEYARTLPEPILENNRYDAEMWICKNKPKIKNIINKDEYKKIKLL